MGMETTSIGIVADEFEKDIDNIESISDIGVQYDQIRVVFKRIVERLTKDVPYAFSGLFPRIVYIGEHQEEIPYRTLNNLRIRLSNVKKTPAEQMERHVQTDIMTLRTLVGML